MNKKSWLLLAGSVALVIGTGLSISLLSASSEQTMFSRLRGVSSSGSEAGDLTIAVSDNITVFRSPNCSCCGLWMDHLEAAGFQVNDRVTEDLATVKQQHQIPDDLATCHTAIMGDYVVEGHVPAVEIQRLLAEQPDIAGLAVPGMPIGSPGMESGDYQEPYTVFAFAENGSTTSFAQYP